MEMGQTSTRVEDNKNLKEKHVKEVDQSTQLHTQLMGLTTKLSKLHNAFLELEGKAQPWINGMEVSEVKLAKGLAKVFEERLAKFGQILNMQVDELLTATTSLSEEDRAELLN
ncbi:hypothetical protein R1sor_014600 [Riccia sorocarpa]|uniref:Uncharacterized protein n=1 Tax=Riccia sorocarpa TaxID=122646 RepID=A0ABD3HBQ6_9MARC